ncbi:MAG: Thiamine pyrophosphokinae [Actinomycetota bacterium]
MPAEEANMVTTSLIFAGGLTPSDATLKVAREIKNVNLVIAADSGLHTATKLGLTVDVVIGDMDSVNAKALTDADSRGTKIIRHDTDKNFTDLHAALLYAAEHGAQKMIVVTAGGGRLDHQFGVIAAMFDPRLGQMQVEALWDNSEIFALQGPTSCDFSAELEDIVGLQAFGAVAAGISTTGLRWKLNNESLFSHETRGVSNQATQTRVAVSVLTGQLLVIHQKKEKTK